MRGKETKGAVGNIAWRLKARVKKSGLYGFYICKISNLVVPVSPVRYW